MGKKQFEHLLGTHCAPTLIGVKAASLISVKKQNWGDFQRLLDIYAKCLQCQGISTLQLGKNEEHVLILFYRAETVARLLQRPAAKKILSSFGYPCSGQLADKLFFLQLRMRIADVFPHEIGLFLGYPPEDVSGFIRYNGRNFFCSGYWKVYANVKQAEQLFQLYTNCTREFCAKLQAGRSMESLLFGLQR